MTASAAVRNQTATRARVISIHICLCMFFARAHTQTWIDALCTFACRLFYYSIFSVYKLIISTVRAYIRRSFLDRRHIATHEHTQPSANLCNGTTCSNSKAEKRDEKKLGGAHFFNCATRNFSHILYIVYIQKSIKSCEREQRLRKYNQCPLRDKAVFMVFVFIFAFVYE